jgi:hypothetical protein
MKFCKVENEQIINLEHLERATDRGTWLELILASGFTVRVEDPAVVRTIRKMLEGFH